MIKHDFVIHLHSQGPLESVENQGQTLGFQHFPRDLANVNDWKIIFDRSINNQLSPSTHLICSPVLNKTIL